MKYYTFDNQFIGEDNDHIPKDLSGIAISPNGNKYWFYMGKQHRENDLPAVEYKNGSQFWFVNGKKHRIEGPATKRNDGTVDYWIYGKQIKNANQESFKMLIDTMKLKGLL